MATAWRAVPMPGLSHLLYVGIFIAIDPKDEEQLFLVVEVIMRLAI